MTKVSKDMIISDVLHLDIGTAPIFLANGMHCIGCPSASGESIEDACMVHGMDPDKLIGELNSYFENSATSV
ncbi:MAG: DUF1858 domain-containing protein [Oscillospiraceae bacterium]|nr:DUF1858 domain-containing protein [Oscillospiraceae bacterium]